MKIPTYIINLATSVARRNYMTNLLKDIPYLDARFVEAVYGKSLSEEEITEAFDENTAFYRYGRKLNRGEIGCALSHRKCYEQLIDSDNDYCLVLEDDITIIRQPTDQQIDSIHKVMVQDRPIVLFLSGDYWYWRRRDIVSVYDATGAYAYFINKAAARLILSSGRAKGTSDDWIRYKRQGVKLYAVYPYCIDANLQMETLSSDVNQDSWNISRKQLSMPDYLVSIITGIVKRILKYCGHFESKVRVINGKPVVE